MRREAAVGDDDGFGRRRMSEFVQKPRHVDRPLVGDALRVAPFHPFAAECGKHCDLVLLACRKRGSVTRQ